jgi:SAM-dependent methyltransferase
VARTPDRIKYHYEVERDLAAQLRRAKPEERLSLYSTVYDELFRRVPDHPQLACGGYGPAHLEDQLRVVRPFVDSKSVFLEIGAGDCRLSLALAPEVRKVYALDVSRVISSQRATPENFELIISDGRSIPAPRNTVDLAFSNQLMEHLHPDDAEGQLRNIVAALRSGGRYVCITPHRFSGPHDISAGFDDDATGLHLREYTNGELTRLCRSAGFSSVHGLVMLGERPLLLPMTILGAVEAALMRLPPAMRRRLAESRAGRKLLGIMVVARR